jgi:hypothetical protein
MTDSLLADSSYKFTKISRAFSPKGTKLIETISFDLTIL